MRSHLRPVIHGICLLVALDMTSVRLLAHTNPSVAVGLLSGFVHPLTGVDHMLAMVAVGIWGTQLGQPAIWLLPVTFPLVMALGGALGARGIPMPAVEIGVAGSAVILGFMIVLAARPRIRVAAVVVGSFAIFHGYAHGAELPAAAEPLAYGVGFVLVTGLLHACGIVLGLADRWPVGGLALRAAGAAISVVGVYLLAGLLS
jgi:urease accessory protein